MRYLSARQMVFDSYHAQRGSVMESAAEIARLGARVQLTQRNNNDWRIVHGLECGQVIAVVEQLPQHLQAMVRYCWGPFTPAELAEDLEWLHAALVRAMMGRRLPGQGRDDMPAAAQSEMLRWLCLAAIYHHGQVTYPYNRPGLHSPRRIQAWLADEHGAEIDVRYWSRGDRLTWGAVWRQMLIVLDDWEAQALGPVANLVPRAA